MPLPPPSQHADAPARATLWHAMEITAVLADLATSASGLSDAEVRERRRVFGENVLPAPRPVHPVVRFLAQFNNGLIYFLLAAAAAAWSLDHTLDAGVILAVVMINAVVGYLQEDKAEKALSAIRAMIAPHATVLRENRRETVPVAAIVPGDLVLIEAGDRVPADLRLIHARGLLIDEAMLTGESVTAEKQENAVAPDAPLGDRSCVAFSGTLVAAGQGRGVAVSTGPQTEIGHINTLIDDVDQLATPLLRQINRFGQRLTWTVLAGAGALFAFATLGRDYAWPDALIAVVALAVGIIPEGLPAVITITLAIGVQRMAARNAIIRRLPAVEALGATSVICTDKTGTLTRNEMTVRRIFTAAHTALVSGAGYAPEGQITSADTEDDLAALEASTAVIRCGLMCNDAHLRQVDGKWLVEGDPMEGALATLAMKAGLNVAHVRAEWTRLDEIPFDARHRFMATSHADSAGRTAVFVKGAPEAVLALCAYERSSTGLTDLRHDFWTEHIGIAASAGERVLAFAMADHVPEGGLSIASLQGLTMLGLVGFIDPPRAEALQAIAECHSAGINVKMITGDHGTTARAIGAQLGLAKPDHVLTGHDLDQVAAQDFVRTIGDTDVFARTHPVHKLQIVKALQSTGAIVAMTGDGVNDAPALKQADVGVAMGQKGTEAAKEAAQMVLLDDNFASIVAAVREGRTVYDNIRKVVSWTLPTNGGEALAVMVAILAGLTMPMTPAQILWINLITSVTLGLVLAFEPPEERVMARKPRAADAPLLSRFLAWRVIFVSMLFMIGALGIFYFALGRGLGLETARTMVVDTIVVFEVFYLFNVRYLRGTSFSLRGALGTKPVLLALAAVVIAQLAFTYAPFMQSIFETRALTLADGALIVGVGIAFMAILEIEKHFIRRFNLFGEFT